MLQIYLYGGLLFAIIVFLFLQTSNNEQAELASQLGKSSVSIFILILPISTLMILFDIVCERFVDNFGEWLKALKG